MAPGPAIFEHSGILGMVLCITVRVYLSIPGTVLQYLAGMVLVQYTVYVAGPAWAPIAGLSLAGYGWWRLATASTSIYLYIYKL